ncbi:MAG: hypothetical protein ACXABD_06060 [Candidatus Thorarchaeota archaeon]|jgi:hypothetical protein
MTLERCNNCGTPLKRELVTVTFKGMLVHRRAVPYCPNNECPGYEEGG